MGSLTTHNSNKRVATNTVVFLKKILKAGADYHFNMSTKKKIK